MCHDDVREGLESLPYVHGVINQKKTCANCHSPHASPQDYFLVAEGKDLCLGCHNKIIATKTRKLSNIKQKIKNSKVVHGAIEFDGCSGCHAGHGSIFPSLLKEKFPDGEYVSAVADTFALCFNCHDAGMLEEDATISGTNFRNGEVNLHYLHINGDKGRNCRFCHDMHASPNEHLITTKVSFGNWEMPLEYKVLENGGSCNTGCHGEKKYIRN